MKVKEIPERMRLITIGSELGNADWKSFIEAWWAAMDCYVEVTKGDDLPYWYNERSNASCLAGAAWSCRGSAIEEFGVERHSKTRASKGRCDLWLKVPQWNLECEIESKMIWGSTFDTTLKDVNEGIDKARDQLLSSYEKRAPVGVAICFVCPEVRMAKDGEEILEELHNYFKICSEKNKYLVAIYRPPLQANILDSEKNYPGVALIGKMVWNRRLQTV